MTALCKNTPRLWTNIWVGSGCSSWTQFSIPMHMVFNCKTCAAKEALFFLIQKEGIIMLSYWQSLLNTINEVLRWEKILFCNNWIEIQEHNLISWVLTDYIRTQQWSTFPLNNIMNMKCILPIVHLNKKYIWCNLISFPSWKIKCKTPGKRTHPTIYEHHKQIPHLQEWQLQSMFSYMLVVETRLDTIRIQYPISFPCSKCRTAQTM